MLLTMLSTWRPPFGAVLLALLTSNASGFLPDEPYDASQPAARARLPVLDARRADWGFAIFGESGFGRLVVGKSPTGGPVEIYLAGPPGHWHALHYFPDADRYEDVFVSEYFDQPIMHLALADVMGGSSPEIVVVLGAGEVVVYGQASKDKLRRFPLGLATPIRATWIGDIEGDARPELIVATDSALLVYSCEGALLWQASSADPSQNVTTMAVGQFDRDPSLEIAWSTGDVVDVASRSVQGHRPEGFGPGMAVADIDSDGIQELITIEDRYSVLCLDVETMMRRWEIPLYPNRVGAIAVGMVDADAQPELLVGDFDGQLGHPGYVRCFDLPSVEEQWRIPNEGATVIAMADSDGDGQLELLWNSGANNTGPDHLVVVDAATLRQEWQSVHLDGPFIGPEQGDVDGDGAPEIVFASSKSDSGYGSGRVIVLDGSTRRLRATSTVPPYEYAQIRDFVLRDIDEDAALEIVVAKLDGSSGALEAYDFDGATNTIQLRWRLPSTPAYYGFYALDVADLDADGDLEIMAGTGHMVVSVIDVATGVEEWRTPRLGGFLATSVVAVRALTAGRSNPELLVLTNDGRLTIFDGVTQDVSRKLNGAYTSLWAPSGQRRSFVVGSSAGRVERFQRGLATYDLTMSLNASAGPVAGAALLEDGRLAVSSGGRLSVYDENWKELLMQTESFGPPSSGKRVLTHQGLYITGGYYAVLGYQAP